MPGLPLAVRETTCSDSRRGDQMCRQQSRICSMSEEEKLAAEESLSLYCKPVELYNVLNRRFVKKPRFLQRNLLYRIHAKHKKRIQVSVSLSRGLNEEIQSCNIFPLYIILAKPCEENASKYWLNRAYMLKSFFEFENKDKTEANFVIPDLKRLASDSRVSNLHIIVISTTGQNGENICENEQLSFPNIGGKCYFGKIPIKLLSSSLENCVTLSLGHKAQMLSKINMQPTYLEPSLLEQNSCISFHPNKEDTSGSFELQVSISAEETGASERTIYDSYTYDNIPSSSLHHIMRLRAGNVLFHYRYYNNTLQRTEVTEDFACPFCYVKCGSFKGLKCHLTACHDLFEFEFLVTEEFQAVCVSLKIDAYKSDLAGQGVDPKLQTFYYRSSYKRRRKSEKTKKFMNQVHADIMQSDSPDETLANNLDQDLLLNENGTTCSSRTLAGQVSVIDTAQTSNLAPPTVLQFGKTRKLSVERADPRNRALLQKRQFFHSHRAQPMAVEQVFSDRDSEDEVDDDIADFEDRRMLDDFVDVTKDEKQIMHLWNSFVRKQRVLADGHIAWACEGFSRLHGKDLVQAPALLWNWRLLMIKLWNHSLLDARTMNNCNLILESFQNDISSPMQT